MAKKRKMLHIVLRRIFVKTVKRKCLFNEPVNPTFGAGCVINCELCIAVASFLMRQDERQCLIVCRR